MLASPNKRHHFLVTDATTMEGMITLSLRNTRQQCQMEVVKSSNMQALLENLQKHRHQGRMVFFFLR